MGGYYISKKENRIELENKLSLKSNKCPYCGSEMHFGFIAAGYPIVWGEELKLGTPVKNTIRLAGPLAPINHIPTLKCNICGIIIGQFM